MVAREKVKIDERRLSASALEIIDIGRSHKFATYASFTLLWLYVLIRLVIHDFQTGFHFGKFVSNIEDRNSLKCGFDDTFLGLLKNTSVAQFHKDLTAIPHTAGTPQGLLTADYILSKFKEFGLESHVTSYFPTLSYPVERELRIVHPYTKNLFLDEEPVDGDPFSSISGVIPPYLAYVPSGNVTGEIVYANYGRVEDFERLADLKVSVRGSIVLVRYGAIFRGNKVTNAAAAGAKAILIYSDPMEAAASLTEGVYPHSRWLPSTGVQRGSALPRLQGDPTSPGWAATEDSERLPLDHPDVTLPRIPGIPISYGVAAEILAGLEGPEIPDWHGGLRIDKYSVGRGPIQVNLNLETVLKKSQIKNVHAIITGSDEPDRFVILGNHHDAWTFGAVDPNSGTAAMLEVARGLGSILKMGWHPRRTLVLSSWDAEEMGLVGSTEWVEDKAAMLAEGAVAYINVDSATHGGSDADVTFLDGGATPQLDLLLWEAASKVKDPLQPKFSLLETWLKASNESKSGFVLPKVRRLGGSGTDYAGFVSHLGIPSVDLFYSDGKSYPMYHTLYDDPSWFLKFADPFYNRVTSVSQLFGLVAIWLSDRKILPFNYETYAQELKFDIDNLKFISDKARKASPGTFELRLKPLEDAVDRLNLAAIKINAEVDKLLRPNERNLREVEIVQKSRGINDRLIKCERGLVAPEGLKSRPWFRHLVYGPVKDNGYDSQVFPGVMDAILYAISDGKAEPWGEVQHEIYRVARAVDQAAQILNGVLM